MHKHILHNIFESINVLPDYWNHLVLYWPSLYIISESCPGNSISGSVLWSLEFLLSPCAMGRSRAWLYNGQSVWLLSTHHVTVNLHGWSLRTTNQLTRYLLPMLVKCWPTVFDAVPTFNQHWFNVLCLLGMQSRIAEGWIVTNHRQCGLIQSQAHC